MISHINLTLTHLSQCPQIRIQLPPQPISLLQRQKQTQNQYVIRIKASCCYTIILCHCLIIYAPNIMLYVDQIEKTCIVHTSNFSQLFEKLLWAVQFLYNFQNEFAHHLEHFGANGNFVHPQQVL